MLKYGNLVIFHKKGYSNYIALAILFLLQCFTPVAMFLVYPFLLIILLTCSLQNGLSYLIYTIPFYIVNKTLNVVLFIFCALVFFIRCLIVVFRDNNQKITSKSFYLLISLLCFSILPIGEYNINKIIRIGYVAIMFLLIIILIKSPNLINLKFNLRLFIISLLMSSIFSATYFISPYLQERMYFSYADNMIRFEALIGQTNVFAMCCEVVLTLMLFRIIKKDVNYIDYILSGVLAVVSIFTLSKMYYIILFIILFMFFIVLVKRHKKLAYLLAISLISIFALVCILKFDFVQTMINRFFGSFSLRNTLEENLNIITTYRYNLWKEYITATFSNPLIFFFGSGLGAKPISTLSAHNAYISMFYQFGLIGTTLFVLSIISIIKNDVKLKFDKALIAPIVIFSLMLFIEDTIFYIYK